MAVLRFVLSPQQCAQLYDVLSCLAKFSETVCIEARFGQLLLSSLNSSLSAYSLFILSKEDFFWSYEFDADVKLRDDRFTCRLLNRSLASVFKGRLGDSKTGDGGVERCEASFEDGNVGEESRLVMKLVYQQGITKTFKLTYEAAEMMQAVFDKGRARNSWRAPARMLRELSEYFGPKTEQLAIHAESEQVTLTSYTEKVMRGKETLKQPLHTSITLDTSDFDLFSVQEDLHVAISIKDFRTIISHASTMQTVVTALYSNPAQPLQFSYSGGGMRCEFTLMTLGDFRGSAPPISRAPTREPTARPPNAAPAGVSNNTERSKDAASTDSASRGSRSTQQGRLGRRLPSQPSYQTQAAGDADADSLFVPAANDDDLQWQPVEDREPEGAKLGWDTSGHHDSGMRATFLDGDFGSTTNEDMPLFPESGVLPTQRASEFRGLFD